MGKSCRNGVAGARIRRRSEIDPAERVEDQHMQVDPMMTADCRVRPEATDRFAATDALHAMVRLYPAEKLAKKTPESWTASFVLRSAVETEKEIPFVSDSESGYLAYVEVPLNMDSIRPGAHTLDVLMKGPGFMGA